MARTTKAKVKPAVKRSYTFAATDIEELRQQGASWKAVADKLGLKGPGAARTAFTELTGKHHNDIEGVTVQRATRAATNGDATPRPRKEPVQVVDLNPNWNAESDQDAIIARLEPEIETDSKGRRQVVRMAHIVVLPRARDESNTDWFLDFDVEHLHGLAWDKDERNLCVNFRDARTGGHRTVRVQDIVEVS